MTSDSNTQKYVWEDDDFWDRMQDNDEFWGRIEKNIFEPILVKPMRKPLTATWDLAISDSDTEKLQAGFRPRNQDDKYAFLIQDEDGNISFHISRHFSHEDEFILHMAPRPSDDTSASAKIHSITWEGGLASVKDDAEKAKERIVGLARVVLNCDFENAPANV